MGRRKKYNEVEFEQKQKNKNTESSRGFNFTRGKKTPKGTKPFVTRMITKEHSIFSQFFNEDGTKKEIKEEEQKQNEGENKDGSNN